MKRIFFAVIVLGLLLTSLTFTNAQDETYYMKVGDVLTWSNLNAAKITDFYYQDRKVYVQSGAELKMTFFNVAFSPAEGIYMTNPRGINEYSGEFKMSSAPKYCILLTQYYYQNGQKRYYYYWAKYKPGYTKATVFANMEVSGYLAACVNDSYYRDNRGTFSVTLERTK